MYLNTLICLLGCMRLSLSFPFSLPATSFVGHNEAQNDNNGPSVVVPDRSIIPFGFYAGPMITQNAKVLNPLQIPRLKTSKLWQRLSNMHKTSGSLGPAFPVDFNSVGGIVVWIATHSWELMIHARVCSSENKGLMPLVGGDEMIEMYNDMLQGLAELLRNKTAANILHSIKLPPDLQNNTMVKPYDDFMDAAGLPRSDSSTMLGFMKTIQYAMYQDIFGAHHSCPIPVVRCGENTVNPCDVYPPLHDTP